MAEAAAVQRGQTGRGAVGRGERAEDLHQCGGVHGEPGRLLALRVREERVHGGRQHKVHALSVKLKICIFHIFCILATTFWTLDSRLNT